MEKASQRPVGPENAADNGESSRSAMPKILAAAILVLLVLGYTAGVLSGYIHKDHRIDASHLTLILGATLVVLLLVAPETFERILKFEVAGIKVEMEAVKKKQEEQADQLASISILLPLVLPENERAHLFHLADGKTTTYEGGGALQHEIRHLRSMGLIALDEDRRIADMHDGVRLDLADFARLTDRGREWVNLIRNGATQGTA